MTPGDRFRFTLGVADVARSAAFYRTFLGCGPAAEGGDAARFEPADPPLVLTLVRRPKGQCTPLGSPGLRLPTREAVLALRDRMTRAGARVHTQECTHCGYNEQFKVHVADPDGNDWSVYAVARQIHPSEIHRCLEGPEAVLPPEPVVHAWEPPPGQPVPARIPYPDDSLDEVRLHAAGDEPDAALIGEAYRALRPGGTVRVAATAGAWAALHAAGFRGSEVRDGAVTGFKPDHGPTAKTRLVLYKGPFRQTCDDFGNVYPRGHRIAVDEAAWTLLRRGAAADQFLFLFPFGYPAACPVRPPEPRPEDAR